MLGRNAKLINTSISMHVKPTAWNFLSVLSHLTVRVILQMLITYFNLQWPVALTKAKSVAGV